MIYATNIKKIYDLDSKLEIYCLSIDQYYYKIITLLINLYQEKFLYSLLNTKNNDELLEIFFEYIYNIIYTSVATHYYFNDPRYWIFNTQIIEKNIKSQQIIDKINEYIHKICPQIIKAEFTSTNTTFNKEEMQNMRDILTKFKQIIKKDTAKIANAYKTNKNEFNKVRKGFCLNNKITLYEYLFQKTRMMDLYTDYDDQDQYLRRINAVKTFIKSLIITIEPSKKSIKEFDAIILDNMDKIVNFDINRFKKIKSISQQYVEYLNKITYYYFSKFLSLISMETSDNLLQHFSELIYNNFYIIFGNNNIWNSIFKIQVFDEKTSAVLEKLNKYLEIYYIRSNNQFILLKDIFTKEEISAIQNILIELQTVITNNQTYNNKWKHMKKIITNYLNILIDSHNSAELFNFLKENSLLFVAVEKEYKDKSIQEWKNFILTSIE